MFAFAMLVWAASGLWMIASAYGGWRRVLGPPAEWRPEWSGMIRPVFAVSLTAAVLPLAMGVDGPTAKVAWTCLVFGLITLPVCVLSAWLLVGWVRATQEQMCQ